MGANEREELTQEESAKAERREHHKATLCAMVDHVKNIADMLVRLSPATYGHLRDYDATEIGKLRLDLERVDRALDEIYDSLAQRIQRIGGEPR